MSRCVEEPVSVTAQEDSDEVVDSVAATLRLNLFFFG